MNLKKGNCLRLQCLQNLIRIFLKCPYYSVFLPPYHGASDDRLRVACGQAKTGTGLLCLMVDDTSEVFGLFVCSVMYSYLSRARSSQHGHEQFLS